MNDLKFAVRQAMKSPGFTAIIVLTLALGIGANTSLFTAIDAVMFRPLPAKEPGRLVFFANGREETFSFPFYERLREGVRSVQDCAAAQYRAPLRQLGGSDANVDTEEIAAQAVTANFFDALGVPPLVGRTFVDADNRKGAPEPVAVISHALWQRRFASDPTVVGRTIRLDNVALTVVGVMPPGFVGFQPDVSPDVWWPLQLVTQLDDKGQNALAEGVSWLVLFGRLGPGTTRDQAQMEVSTFYRTQLLDQVSKNPDQSFAERERILQQNLELQPGGAGFIAARSEFRQPLVVLMAAVAIVLLIASSNIAGLLLARSATRRREFAVRAALGAGRRRIIRQLMTESLLLALAGGAVGLVIAYWGTHFLASYLAQSSTPLALVPDARALVFTVFISLGTAVIFGLAPASQLMRLDYVTAIKENSAAATGGGPRARLQPFLVIAQVALSVALLACATLFVRTLQNLRSLNFGFQSDNLVTLSIDRGRTRRDPAQMQSLLRQVIEELETLPGIQSASIGGAGLLTGNGIVMDLSVDGYSEAPGEDMRSYAVLAGPRFFETMRVPLLKGREFTRADEPRPGVKGEPEHATVAIIGEAMAKRFFGNSDPTGRYFTVHSEPNVQLQIIGVARDTMYSPDLRKPIPLQFFVPFFGSGIRMPPTFYLRANKDVAVFRADVQRTLARVDPQLKVKELRPMNAMIDHLLLRERIIAQLLSFFSAFALLLSCLGLYGMLAFQVAQRTREIGIRIALGATIRNVTSLVIRHGLSLAVCGSVIGICAAVGLGRFVATLLYGVTPADPGVLAIVAGLFSAAALLASWLPARRAARVDPMVALRCD